MTGIDFYRSTDLDASIILNFPKGMTGVLSALTDILKEKGKYVVDEGSVSISRARDIIAEATGDTKSYFIITTNDPKVWSVLKEAVNRDDIRVIGVFHGEIPDEVPENVVLIDIGRSLHRKVTKNIVSSINESLTTKDKYPTGRPEELYFGIQTLCYEVLYSPEYRVFSRNATSNVPRARAFDFMYNPPTPLSDQSMRSAVTKFVEDIHGWLS